MKIKNLFGVALMGALFAQGATAEGGAGVQVAAFGGQQRLRIDHDRLITDETMRMDTAWMGLEIGYRFAPGLLIEGGYGYSVHEDWFAFNQDESLDLHHHSLALGWQFENEGWRFTPKAGVIRSKLNSEQRLLFNDNGGRTDKYYATVPFAEAQLLKRLGDRWTLGFTVRDVREEFGHTRAWGVVASLRL